MTELFGKLLFHFFKQFSRNEKLILTVENEIFSTSSELNPVFSNFFSNAVEKLKFLNISNFTQNENNDSHKEALSYFENHPRIVNIKRKGFDTSFTFRETNSNEVTLNINKACQNTDINTKIIKSNAELFYQSYS